MESERGLHRVRRAAALAGLAWTFAGCAWQPGLDRPVPVPEVAELFPRQEIRQEMRQGEDASRLAWSAYFTDPALRQLIALALDQNRDLRIAAHRAAQARAIFAARRAERLPVIALSAQADRA